MYNNTFCYTFSCSIAKGYPEISMSREWFVVFSFDVLFLYLESSGYIKAKKIHALDTSISF